jgi:glycosyltransferase involved in cell wall biosynthesis
LDISVIIATYNCERYIGRAIRSLISQSFAKERYEIIVVDDGSTDHTRQVLESFGDWIKVIPLEEHKGLPYACNEGVKKALGYLVVRVDADDYVHEDFLKAEYLFLSLNPDFDAVACDYYLVDEHESHVARKNCDTEPIACGIMFKKDNIVEIGLYDEKFLMLEEVDLRIRYLQKFKIHRIELPLYRYRRHKSNITSDKKSMQHYQNLLKEKHGETTPPLRPRRRKT